MGIHERNSKMLPMLGASSGAPLTMSSREIADLCEKNHADVLRDIRVMLEQLDEVASKFAGNYVAANGKKNPCYDLPKDLTLTLVAGYNVVLRKRIIDRWLELEGQGAYNVPQTLGEALQLAADQAKRIEAMREDVEAHERLTRAEGSLNVTEAAKNLGIRPKDLFDWLSQHGWTYKRANSPAWLGYQTKCNQGLLEHKTTTVLRADGSEKITEQVRVTAKGLSLLAKLIKPTVRLVY